MSDDLQDTAKIAEQINHFRKLVAHARKQAEEAHSLRAKELFIIAARGWESLAQAFRIHTN